MFCDDINRASLPGWTAAVNDRKVAQVAEEESLVAVLVRGSVP